MRRAGRAARVGELERMLDVNLKLTPRTEGLGNTAERMRGASGRIQSAMAGTGRTVYLFNYAIGIGCVVGGSIVVWKGIEWHAYVLSVLGGLLALIGAALTVVGARVVRFYGATPRSALDNVRGSEEERTSGDCTWPPPRSS